ncbi:MAG: EcoKI restriction-modification system protein HsdS [Alphaproteobacteria bacterium ADurb.Bin438]|nr:MAG: EcoKI restriction-modification system protein HsdS [Alphaproteobacteria bacterium ADurb.Bin438]
MSLTMLDEIKEKFDNSKLPFIVNFTDFNKIDEEFYQKIKPDLFPVGWEVKKLGDVSPFKYGKGLPESKRKKGVIPVFGSNGIVGYHDEAFIEKKGIVIGRKGSVGQVNISKSHFWVIDTAFYVDDVLNNDMFFIYYMLQTLGLEHKNSDAAVPGLNRDNAHNININLPPIDIQKKIAGVLSGYDDLIENNNKRIKILEDMAKKIYKHWFIDFKFPNHEKTKFKPSELGPIPENWEVKKLGDVVDLSIGRTPPRKESQWFSNSEGVKWISIKDIGLSNTFIHKTSERLTCSAIKKFNVPIIKKRTVILSFKLTIGRVAITSEDMCSNEAIAQLPIIDNVISNEYLYSYLLDFKYESLGSTSSIGKAINSKILKDMPIVVPDSCLMDIYSKLSSSLIDNIRVLDLKNETLKNTRDMLLPRLISGEVDLKNVEVKV